VLARGARILRKPPPSRAASLNPLNLSLRVHRASPALPSDARGTGLLFWALDVRGVRCDAMPRR